MTLSAAWHSTPPPPQKNKKKSYSWNENYEMFNLNASTLKRTSSKYNQEGIVLISAPNSSLLSAIRKRYSKSFIKIAWLPQAVITQGVWHYKPPFCLYVSFGEVIGWWVKKKRISSICVKIVLNRTFAIYPSEQPNAHCLYCCLVSKSCLTLCYPMDCSPLGSSVPGIFLSKNTAVACHFLLQGIFLTQGWNSHCLQF